MTTHSYLQLLLVISRLSQIELHVYHEFHVYHAYHAYHAYHVYLVYHVFIPDAALLHLSLLLELEGGASPKLLPVTF